MMQTFTNWITQLKKLLKILCDTFMDIEVIVYTMWKFMRADPGKNVAYSTKTNR